LAGFASGNRNNDELRLVACEQAGSVAERGLHERQESPRQL
jgi:hypothetical protein